jgi:raffinose/stachyose/melibiose transport system permease protein
MISDTKVMQTMSDVTATNRSLRKKKSGFLLDRKRLGKGLTIFLFLLPALIIFITFVIIPVVQAAFFAFWDWNGLGPLRYFAGFDNFVKIFKHDVFHKALSNNILIVVFSLVLQLPLALFLALIIGRKFPGRTVFRALFFLPFILSDVVAGIIWQFIYHPQTGLINFIIGHFVTDLQPVGLLGDTKTVFFAIFTVIWWKFFGLHMVIYIAGLQGIPLELEEAALIDGASHGQTTRYIILPLLWNTIRISVFFSIIGSFQVFDVVWAMSKGGPVNASEVMVTYLYKFGFTRYALGYGSAVAVIIFLICLGFNIIYQKTLYRPEKER